MRDVWGAPRPEALRAWEASDPAGHYIRPADSELPALTFFRRLLYSPFDTRLYLAPSLLLFYLSPTDCPPSLSVRAHSIDRIVILTLRCRPLFRFGSACLSPNSLPCTLYRRASYRATSTDFSGLLCYLILTLPSRHSSTSPIHYISRRPNGSPLPPFASLVFGDVSMSRMPPHSRFVDLALRYALTA
jgi:hypothetical protein